MISFTYEKKSTVWKHYTLNRIQALESSKEEIYFRRNICEVIMLNKIFQVVINNKNHRNIR